MVPERDEERQQPKDKSAGDDSGAETNELAVASLFLGIFWVFGFGSVAGIWLGVKSLREIERSDGGEGGRAFAWAGIVSGGVGLISLGFIFVIAFGP